jgi:hypothetical protein
MLARQLPPDDALDVVALTAVDFAETLPAASYAATEYVYAVPEVSPESVYVVPLDVPTSVVPR